MTDLVANDQLPVAATLPLLPLVPEIAATGDPYRIYLDSLDKETSRDTMRGCLDRITRLIIEAENGEPLPQDVTVTGECREWWNLRYEHTTRIRTMLLEQHDWTYSYVNKHLSALRRVLKECWRLGLMSAEDYHRAIDIPSIEGTRRKAGRSIHEAELAAMLRVSEEEDGPSGPRNAALVAVLWSTGIRRAEAAGALIERYDPGERSLRVIGKRNKERVVFVVPDAVPALDRWLSRLGVRKGPLFRRIDKWGNISEHGMSPIAIGNIVDRVRRSAGLPPLGPHDFRRTYAGLLLNSGADLSTAQKLMGHASPTTTAGYDPRPELVLRDASDKLRMSTRESPRDAEPLPHDAVTEN